MKKEEYIESLCKELQDCPEDFRQDILDTIEEHFTEGMSRGYSEEQIAQELGDVKEMAEDLRGMAKSEEEQISGADVRAADAPAAQTAESEVPAAQTASPASSQDVPRCLVVECIDTGTDVHMTPGDTLTYHFVEKEGFTIGNGLFIRSALLGKRQKAEVLSERTGDEYRIAVHGAGGDLYVQVPAGVRQIRAKLSSGDLELNDICADRIVGHSASGDIIVSGTDIADTRLESVSGDVKITRSAAKKLDLYTVSGDLEAENVSGILEGKSASGDIKIQDHTGASVTVSTKSGDIDVHTSGNIEAKSLSGDLRICMDETADSCRGTSVSGDVKCTVPGADFTADLRSISGSVRNKTAIPAEGRSNNMVLGRGRMQIYLKSTSGNVTIQN